MHEYWLKAPTPVTQLKHRIWGEYAMRWLGILGQAYGRCILVDGFCGRGKHETGHKGSPLQTIEILRDMCSRFSGMQSTEFRFYFCDSDAPAIEALHRAIDDERQSRRLVVPTNLNIAYTNQEFMQFVDEHLQTWTEQKSPILLFVDPFGFSHCDMSTLTELSNISKCEVMLVLMVKSILQNYAVRTEREHIDSLYGDQTVFGAIHSELPHKKSQRIIELYTEALEMQTNFKYVTPFTLWEADKNQIAYCIYHLTNHELGFDKIKEVMWGIDPSTGSVVKASSDELQMSLPTEIEPDLNPLTAAIMDEYEQDSEIHIKEIREFVRFKTMYLGSHCSRAIDMLCDDKEVHLQTKSRRKYLVFAPPPPEHTQQSLL